MRGRVTLPLHRQYVNAWAWAWAWTWTWTWEPPVRDGRAAVVNGVTTGMVGQRLTPWVRLPGQSGDTPQVSVRTVDADGEFTWQRQANKKVYVYFRAGDGVRSNRVMIPAR